ncbi:hypothetical protein [Mesorhizobium sp.]|nr:hypothetical protein [Mesorhizobium sp.]RWP94146.1 MAG: hypothetical protein EOR89_31635 [Mesorhizobium sp.]RWQ49402.1 MAG: hypothetical protein EOS82_16785 [Mesorhizobium sp.]
MSTAFTSVAPDALRMNRVQWMRRNICQPNTQFRGRFLPEEIISYEERRFDDAESYLLIAGNG